MKKILLVFLVFIVLIGCKTGNNASLAYTPIRYEEAVLEMIEKDGELTEEDFRDLSNYVRVLHNCGIVPYSRIECVEEVKVIEHGSFYRIKCSCDTQLFSIDAARATNVRPHVYIWMLTENDEDGFLYYFLGHHCRLTNSKETRQNSLAVLQEHCSFTEDEAFGLMREIDMIFDVERIYFYDIASIEQVKRERDIISLSLTSNFGTHYDIVISTVNRPIILSITDSDGQVLYESEER